MERFSQRARRVLSSAQETAESLNSASIDTEHLLLGLMREDGGVAGRVLRDLGLDLGRLEDLAAQLTKSEERPASAQLALSAGTKQALEFAVDEARRLEHKVISSEHLLLGLVRLEDSVAYDMLQRLGVSREQVRRQVDTVLQDSAAENAPLDVSSSYQDAAPRHFDYFLLRASSRSSGGISQLTVDLSAEVKDALEEALKEVGYNGVNRLEASHLLLGLLHNREGVLRRMLTDAEINLDELIRNLRHPKGA